jgi:hypothetical protein
MRATYIFNIYKFWLAAIEAHIISVVRIPTGLYLARIIADLKVPKSFDCFQLVIHSLGLKWLVRISFLFFTFAFCLYMFAYIYICAFQMAMKEICKCTNEPRSFRLVDDSEDNILPTMPTPKKKKRYE